MPYNNNNNEERQRDMISLWIILDEKSSPLENLSWKPQILHMLSH